MVKKPGSTLLKSTLLVPTLLFFLFLTGVTSLPAQDAGPAVIPETFTYQDPNEIYEKALTAFSEESYEEAVALLETIGENDSIYFSAKALQVSVLIDMDDYQRVIELCDQCIRPGSAYNFDFYQGKGLAYLRLGAYEQSNEVYRQLLDIYPKSYLARYNLAIGYEKSDQVEKAAETYVECIRMNPYYSDPHRKLGQICESEKLLSQAILCYNTYLLLEPRAGEALNTLIRMEGLLTSKSDATPVGMKVSLDDESFSLQDLILRNYIGLNEEYRVDCALDLPFVKQEHCLFESLEDYSGNGGFFNTYYVPLHRRLKADQHFNNFIYRILSSVGNEDYQATIKKNYKDEDAFISWLADNITDLLGEEITAQGDTLRYTFRSSGELESLSRPVPGKPGQRFHEYYHENGNLSAMGIYANGSRIGDWKWWKESGHPHEQIPYQDGQPHGIYKIYHDNGQLHKSIALKANTYHGPWLEYDRNGLLTSINQYLDGNLCDTSIIYHEAGAPFVKYRIPYSDGLMHGKVFEYYHTGQLRMSVTFDQGEYTGREEYFDQEGKLTEYYVYENGELSGTSESYNPDGQLVELRQHRAGNPSGIWKAFYVDSLLSSETSYNEQGEYSGVSKIYHRNGTLVESRNYDANILKSYAFYDEEGKELSSGSVEQDGSLNYLAMNYNGSKQSEGMYSPSGERDKKWTFHNENGCLISREYFENGKLNGEDREYFVGGELKQLALYQDGMLNGPLANYLGNGTLESISYYVNGSEEGIAYSYFPDGSLSMELYSFHGELQGWARTYSVEQKPYKTYYFDQGKPLFILNHDTSGAVLDTFRYFKDGNHQEFYPNGKLKVSEHYKNGDDHGSYLTYHINGRPEVKGVFFTGKRHDSWEWHNEEGQLTRKGSYIEGSRSGEWLDYHDNGELRLRRQYRRGELHGTYRTFAENGRLTYEGNYLDGEKNGSFTYYSESGEVKMVRIYEYNRFVAYTCQGSDNELLPLIPVELETADVKCYYANGNPSVEYSIYAGKLHGKYTNYYPDGSPAYVDIYHYGDNQGESTEYHSNGKLKHSIMWLNDEQHGSETEYYPNGNIKQESSYLNGAQTGTSIYYKEDGSRKRKVDYYNGEAIHETIY
ncbi:MAG: hypothetical protein ABFS28_14765 [Bacteroidota bacterium]